MKVHRLKPIIGSLLVAVLAVSAGAHAQAMAGSHNPPAPEDERGIRLVLSNYTKSVSSGDRALFESQLLDLNIPFAGIGRALNPGKVGLASIQDYKSFRATIFDSGAHYLQRFSNVNIEQVGNLAQVSLDYETTLQGQEFNGKGWKVVQLVKVGQQWKIASEFWTGYPTH